MAISGKKLSELKNKVTDIKGNERIYVSDGSGTPKYIETNQLATSKQIENKSDIISEKNGSTGEVTQEINPNTFYKFGECTTLNITLGAKVDGIYNEYMFQFRSGDTPTVLDEIAGVSWIGDNTIKANTTYVVVIHDGILAALGGA